LLCTSRALRAALDASAACWEWVAGVHFGADAAQRRAPLTSDALASAALTSLAALDPFGNIPAGWHTPVRVLSPASGRAWPALLRAKAVQDARAALPPGRATVEAGALSAWASSAAPVKVESHKAAVVAYSRVVGGFGCEHGGRAARAWARLERCLESLSPHAHASLLPSWRAPTPPPDVIDAGVAVHPSVAAVLALHAGQDCRGDAGRALSPRDDCARREGVAAAAAGMAGAVFCDGALHSGFLNAVYAPAEDTNAATSSFIVLQRRGPSIVGVALDSRAVRPLLVSVRDAALHGFASAPEVEARTLWLHLETGAVYGRAAAVVGSGVLGVGGGGGGGGRTPRRARRAGLNGVPATAPIALIRADGGTGLLGWLEALAARMEAGLCQPSPAVVQQSAVAWEAERGLDTRPWEACLPGLACPLLDSSSPAEVAAMAAAWPRGGLSVSLHGQLQTGLSLAYSVRVDDGGGSCAEHAWFCNVSVRLLEPPGREEDAVPLTGDEMEAKDAASTWPRLEAWPDGEGPIPSPTRPPPLRAARLRWLRWVVRDDDGRVVRTWDETGPLALSPHLIAGEGGRPFSFTTRINLPAEVTGRAGTFAESVLPGSTCGWCECAFMVEGEREDDGGSVRFWSRAVGGALRVAEWRF
jgi:hypothetical protein